MAKGIRKGFFFYFGLFVLLLVTIFCICLVCMMFNPGKSILWMTYFTSNSTYTLEEALSNAEGEDSKVEPIDWSKVNTIEIDCGYADVTVERNNDPNYEKDGFYIRNKAKGFAVAKNFVKFDIESSFNSQSGRLIVKVTEPTGFMYFSKDVAIILHSSIKSSNVIFANKNINVTTTSGNVDIGGTASLLAEDIKLQGLSVETISGNISLSQKFDTSSVTKDFSLKTISGSISSAREVEFLDRKNETQSGKGILANVGVNLEVEGRGAINLSVLNVHDKNVKLSCKNGNMKFDYLQANQIDVDSKEGNHDYGIIYGNINYNNSDPTLLAPNIMIDYIKGAFYLTAIKESKASPDITINEMDGLLEVNSETGKVKVKKQLGKLSIDGDKIETDITFAETYDSRVLVRTNSSTVNLTFLGVVPNNASITTNTGNVNINVTNSARFTANLFKNDSEQNVPLEESKVHINVGTELDYKFEEGKVSINDNPVNEVTVITNSNVNFNLILK